jgi:hypothetical protein
MEERRRWRDTSALLMDRIDRMTRFSWQYEMPTTGAVLFLAWPLWLVMGELGGVDAHLVFGLAPDPLEHSPRRQRRDCRLSADVLLESMHPACSAVNNTPSGADLRDYPY